MSPPLPPEIEAAIRRVHGAAGLPPSRRVEVDDDLRAHFEDGLAAGRSPEELLRRFGDPDEAGRRIASVRGVRVTAPHALRRVNTTTTRWTMTGRELWTEMKRAARTLLRAPGFTAVVVVTLALGVGANTAVFTVLDAALLAPLPYEDSHELVRVYEGWSEHEEDLNYLRGPAAVEYAGWRDVFESFGVLFTYDETGADLTDGEMPERIVVSPVDAGFFETMGVPPVLGRTFAPEESVGSSETIGRQPARPLAVLSHDLWQRRFGGDPGVVGSRLRMDDTTLEVVGVMPAGFTNPFGSLPDLWVPQDLRMGDRNDWGNHYLSGVARLPEGVTVEAAQRRVDALNRGLMEAEPEAEGWDVRLRPLRSDLVGETRTTLLWILAGAVGLVLLSACVNVANLIFARSLGKRRDLAVRGALGSGRARLVAHLFAESALLAAAGGLVGLGVGWLGVELLPALAPDALPALVIPELSARVFVMALGATTLALLAFGLLPAVRLSAASPADALRGGGRGGTGDRSTGQLRNGLIVAQVAVAVVLVVGAGLLFRSFESVRSVELGIEPEGVLTFEVHLPSSRYPDGPSRHGFHERFQTRVAGLGGVEAVGATSWLPVQGRYNSWGFAIDLDRLDDDGVWYGTDVRIVAGDYFGAMGIDVERGEGAGAMDPSGPPVAWVNRTLVEEVFEGADPLGRLIQVGGEPRTVVGVVEDVPHTPRGDVTRKIYIPHAHYADDRNWALVQTVRSRGDLTALRAHITEELRAVDPSLVLYRPRPFTGVLASARAEDRFAMTLMGIFAALALGLSILGIYGVLANAVARRRREIGIRMALGADAGRVRELVVGSALMMTALGAALGVGGAWIGGRWLRTLLFEVEPGDPLVLVGAVLVLMVLGALAAWIPARRATSVDPARTLGAE